MMKPLYSGVLLLASVYFNAQTTTPPTGKVGVNTITPKETLDVNGTLKVGNLPTNGTANAIYNGGKNKSTTFTATNMVVADANGVLGKTSIPIIPTEPWRKVGGSTEATSNTDNIYQNGNVGIGNFGNSKTLSNKLEVEGSTKLNGALRVTGNSILDGTLNIAGRTTLNNELHTSNSVGTAGQVLMSKGENSAPEWKSLKEATGVISQTELKIGTTEITVSKGEEKDIPGLTYTITVPAEKEKIIMFNIVGYAAPDTFGGTQGVFELFHNGKKISSAYAVGVDAGDRYLRGLTSEQRKITTDYLATKLMNTVVLGKIPIPATLMTNVTLKPGTHEFVVKYKSWFGTSKINVDASKIYTGSTTEDNEALLSKMLITIYNVK